jgi:hypothetical protein
MPRDPFRNFNQYKIDPLSEIRNAGITTNGDVFWVSSVADSGHTTRRNDYGRSVVKESLQEAVDAAKDNNNDYVLVIPTDNGTARALSTSVDVNKDRLHIIGVGAGLNNQSYGITFNGFGTTAAGTPVDTALLEVTGGGVEVAKLRFLGTMGTSAGGTVTNGILRVGTGSSGTAHDLWVHDASFEWNQASQSELAILTTPGTVHGARFDNVWFGNASTGAESAGNAGLVQLPHGGKRWTFRDSTFVYNSGSVAVDQIIRAGTGATEYARFIDCSFFSLGTGLITSAVRGSTTVNNPIIMENCRYVGFTQAGTDPTVFKTPVASGTSAAVRDYGIAVGTAALTPV